MTSTIEPRVLPGQHPPLPATGALPRGLGVASIAIAAVWTALQAVRTVLALGPAPAATAWSSGSLVTLVLVGVQVAAYVVSCLWLARSRSFAAGLRPRIEQQRGAGWVWGGWLVPVVSLWFPYQVVRDVRAATAGTTRVSDVRWWWVAWVVAVTMANQATLADTGLGAFSPESVPVLELTVTVFLALALLGWVRVVREVTAFQHRRAVQASPDTQP